MYWQRQPNGNYKYYQSYKDPRTGKKKIASVTLKGNSRLYQNQAIGLLNEKISKYTDPSTYYADITFRAVVNEWLDFKKLTVKVSTLRNMKIETDRFLKFMGEDCLLQSIKVGDIMEYNSFLIAEGYSISSIKRDFASIKGVFRYSKEKGYILDDGGITAYKTLLPPKTVESIQKENEKYLTHNERVELLEKAYAKRDILGMVVEFQLLTGLRIGELLALRECDYNKDDAVISINGTIQNTKGRPRTAPKTLKSYRMIPLLDRAKEVIEKAIERMKAIRTIHGSQCNPDKYIFVTDEGGILENQYINKQLKKMPINGRTVSTHCLRHTFISVLADNGVPIHTAITLVGHSTSRTMLEIYAHANQEEKRKAMLIISELGEIGRRIEKKVDSR